MSSELIQHFETNGYVHLKDFLDEQNCQELTQILKDFVEQGQTTF